jgi:hypothetical protein
MSFVNFNPKLVEREMIDSKVVYTRAEIGGINAVQAMTDFRILWDTRMTVADASAFAGPISMDM